MAVFINTNPEKHQEQESAKWKPYNPPESYEQNGERIGPWIQIRSSKSKAYQNAVTRAHRKHRRLVQNNGGVLPLKQLNEVIAEFAICNWSGFPDEKGNPFPYSVENALIALTYDNDFSSNVALLMQEEDEEERELEELDAKN